MKDICKMIKRFINRFFQFLIGLEIGILIGILIFFISPNRYDVNRDGKVSSSDYVLIKNYIMEK